MSSPLRAWAPSSAPPCSLTRQQYLLSMFITSIFINIKRYLLLTSSSAHTPTPVLLSNNNHNGNHSSHCFVSTDNVSGTLLTPDVTWHGLLAGASHRPRHSLRACGVQRPAPEREDGVKETCLAISPSPLVPRKSAWGPSGEASTPAPSSRA